MIRPRSLPKQPDPGLVIIMSIESANTETDTMALDRTSFHHLQEPTWAHGTTLAASWSSGISAPSRCVSVGGRIARVGGIIARTTSTP